MRWPIRAQFLTPVALLLLSTAAISFWTAWAAADQARRQIEDRQRDVARFLIDKSIFPLNDGVLAALEPLSGADYLLQRRDRGKRYTSLDLDPDGVELSGPVADDWQALRLGEPVAVAGRTYLCSGVRLGRRPGPGDSPDDVLYILYPESLLRDARWEAIRPSLILGCGVGLAALVVALLQAQLLASRLLELGRRTRRIAGGDFGPMPVPALDDELRDLAVSVNEMAQRLAKFQQTVEQTERFRLLEQTSGGLAHQLRNGLTGARLAVQLFLREHGKDASDKSALEVALRQLTLLETQTRRFLYLGRDSGAGKREPCDLREIASEAVELLRPQCRHAGIELTWSAPQEACEVVGDAGQLAQVVINLLGNAIEAAGPGGAVAIRLKGEAPAEPSLEGEAPAEPARGGESGSAGASPSTARAVIALEVIDTGPGPPPELAGRLFEPFVTGKPEGVGLGLAVAKRAAEGHGGSIGCRREAGRTVFRVELPASGASR